MEPTAIPESRTDKPSIVIIGAGICGLFSALALSKTGHSIRLLERDQPPPAGSADNAFFDWPRRGAAQFRHPHAFLGLMCNLIADNYPDLLEAFFTAGARKLPFIDMLPPALQASYEPEPGDERLWMLLCRRATIETVLRRYVEQLDNVVLENEQRVIGLLSTKQSGQLTVTGVRLQGDIEYPADIVVDASGRNSYFPQWFAELGSPIREERHDAEIVYYTRHYRLRPGIDEPPRDPDRPTAGDLGYLKYGLFPGDHGNFALILCLPVAEKELKLGIRTGATFDRVCREIPGLKPWIGAEQAEATTEPFGIGAIHSVWRHYVEDAQPKALNFFAVGDSAVRTNPLYGRGCSTGTLHAHILAEVLRNEADPYQRALEFEAQTQRQIRPIHKASLAEDKRGIARAAAAASGEIVDRTGSAKEWFGVAFGDALTAAAVLDLEVLRGLHRTINLLEPPGEFLQDGRIRRRVMRYMLRGRKRNAALRVQPGPSRDEAYRLVRE